ncbi:adenosine deaminase, partial [Acrasis kona]
ECDRLPLELIRRLPKADLHHHLDGSIRVSTIIDIAKKNNVLLPTYEEDELRKIIQVGDDCMSLEDYLKAFLFTHSIMQDEESLERCMYEVCQDSFNDGVCYLEVRFAPCLHNLGGLANEQVINSVLRGKNRAENDFDGFHSRIIVCGIRSDTPTKVLEMARLVDQYMGTGVVAFDIAGPEYGFRPDIHHEAFECVQHGLHFCTCHAGEADGPESVRSALKQGAHRIGHGVRIRDDPDLLTYIINHRVPVEMCVTSNLQTKAVVSVLDHPIYEFLQKDVVVVPCTDNTLMSGITLSGEYKKIADHFHLTFNELERLLMNGFESSFNPDRELKMRICEDARTKIRKILSECFEGDEVCESCVLKSSKSK